MARNEADREDLMREATALIQRVEFRPAAAGSEAIVAGFRRDGCLSLYFGADPVYQFDAEGRLRRAFVQGRLYRAQGTALAELTRVRSSEATTLCRRDLSSGQLERFFQEMRLRLAAFRERVRHESSAVLRQIPPNEPVLGRLLQQLDALLNAPLRLAPAINRSR